MKQHIIEPLDCLRSALDAFQLVQALRCLVTEQQRRECADLHLQPILRWFMRQTASAIRKAQPEGAVVPREQMILDIQLHV